MLKIGGSIWLLLRGQGQLLELQLIEAKVFEIFFVCGIQAIQKDTTDQKLRAADRKNKFGHLILIIKGRGPKIENINVKK